MDDSQWSRRDLLRAGAGVGAAATAGLLGATGTAGAQSGGLSSWFENVSNYDGVVDKTGQSEVTVEVGVEANGGAFGFGPAAVRVDPGTTVVWEWTGQGGGHNVVADDGSYESKLVAEAGHTFSHTFESKGVSKYYCSPHKALGMKGAVVVGDVDVGGSAGGGGGSGGGGQLGPVDYGGWFDGVSNFDGTVDKTGQSEVTVQVGVEANGGAFGFGPAAVRVDPGTTVVWEWTGQGGSHNVVANDGSYESKLVAEAGHTFSHTFESEGISKYYCSPHKALGMKGAVVVGDVGGTTGGGEEAGRPFWTAPAGDIGTALFGLIWGTAGLGALAILGAEAYREGKAWRRERAEAAESAGPPVDAPPETVERELDHESFTPYGTATLVAVYFVIVALMWAFMYFVEFLGNGPTIIGG